MSQSRCACSKFDLARVRAGKAAPCHLGGLTLPLCGASGWALPGAGEGVRALQPSDRRYMAEHHSPAAVGRKCRERLTRLGLVAPGRQ